MVGICQYSLTMSKFDVSVKKPRPIWGLFLLLVGLFMLFSLIDYQPQYSSYHRLLHKNAPVTGNHLGSLGVSFAFYACRFFGVVAWLIPVYVLLFGSLMLGGLQYRLSVKKWLCFTLSLLFVPTMFAFLQSIHLVNPGYNFYSAGKGGLLGSCFYRNVFANYFGTWGSALFLIPTALLLLCLSFSDLNGVVSKLWLVMRKLGDILRWLWSKCPKRFSMKSMGIFEHLKHWFSKISLPKFKKASAVSEKAERAYIDQGTSAEENKAEQMPTFRAIEPKRESKKNSEPIAENKPIQILASEKVEKSTDKVPIKQDGYKLPELNLLKDPPPVLNDDNAEDYYETAEELVQKLAEFGVEVKVEAIQSGPVITRYEVTPARGVRVEKIATLDKNIALGLKALSIRIQAPVPGKGCVGIEVPNKKPLPVFLKEILGSKAWAQSDAEIPIVLGKEVTGKPIVADLTKMPHLLIAGSTGSGKTVCINAIIASLLFRASPKDLRFIMVDPKIVEMKVYNDLPHMLIPVVTDPKRVPFALKWLIGEMERRYQLFADLGVRNLAGFNEKLKKLTLGELEERHLEHLPYIVCVIDELADLMMVAPGDIETSIARLAQLARAAGIHLIIATQRPSVNVITGIIKANLPSRIAFKVASKVDSRTILDMGGADSLIGRGDMLFIPPGASQLVRAQGAWVSDDEITNIVEFLKCNGAPNFAQDVQDMIANSGEENTSFQGDSDGDDELMRQAIEVLKTSDRISTSLLQRRLKIGYNRAARIMETLDERGLVPKNFE